MGVNPIRLDVNEPMPVPLFVFVANAIVGFGFVDHTTPLAVIAAPPSEVTFPPPFTVVGVIALIAEVVMEGIKFIVNEVVLRDVSAP